MEPEIEEIIQGVKPRWREAFRAFVDSGTTEKAFLDHLDSNPECQRLVDRAFRSKAAELQDMIRGLDLGDHSILAPAGAPPPQVASGISWQRYALAASIALMVLAGAVAVRLSMLANEQDTVLASVERHRYTSVAAEENAERELSAIRQALDGSRGELEEAKARLTQFASRNAEFEKAKARLTQLASRNDELETMLAQREASLRQTRTQLAELERLQHDQGIQTVDRSVNGRGEPPVSLAVVEQLTSERDRALENLQRIIDALMHADQGQLIDLHGELESVPESQRTAIQAALGRIASAQTSPFDPIPLDQRPEVISHQTKLQYPREAKRAGVGGTVVVAIRVDNQGAVKEAEILRSVPGLDAAALSFAVNTKFEPARDDDGEPRGGWIAMGVPFSPQKAWPSSSADASASSTTVTWSAEEPERPRE